MGRAIVGHKRVPDSGHTGMYGPRRGGAKCQSVNTK